MVPKVFEDYFKTIYGQEWGGLLESMRHSEQQIAYEPFSGSPIHEFLENHQKYKRERYNSEERHDAGYLKNYILDPASLAPVHALNISAGHKVCDLCAAPGGKSLAILAELKGEGQLISNDSSKDRFFRLRKVLAQYVPQDYQKLFRLTMKDGQKFGFLFKEEFDRVLVDTPCSSERHLLDQRQNLESWTPKKSKMLSQKQYTLLCAALLICKSKGKIVYSTCSINPQENDFVIEKFLNKKSNFIEVDTFDFSYLNAVKTKYGYMIRPDISGFGPIYFSRLTKK